ncbi:MAG: TonB-dependent receptor, partial [Cyclobacteriaceae bacterium]
MKFLPLFFLSLFLSPCVLSAQSTQTVRGQIMDQDSKYPIYGANIVVLKSDPLLGAATDEQGYFVIENVPLGRVDLRITAIGYKEITVNNLLVISGKELNLDFEIEETFSQLEAVVVNASEDKVAVNNDLATVSARSFNVEETTRYAGSRNDPARMAANFAGVSGANDSRNDIIIRGNSPAGVLWRLEGIDIPSPNHFSSFGSTGGPVSMLNNNLLSKSDFITAAFPANYGNALAGVFDLQMRNGNPEKREFLGQIGFNGFEFGLEGPFSSKGKASYLVNYRYSTLGAFEAVGINFGTGTAIPKYQDLSFKVNIPTEKFGRFVVFGLGGDSDINLLGSDLDLEKEDETDLFGNENDDIYVESRTGIIGVSHTYYFNPNTFYKLTLAASHQRQNVQIDSLSNIDRSIATRYVSLNLRQNKYSAHLMFNRKFNARNNLTAGAILDLYDIIFADSSLVRRNDQLFWFSEKEGNGTSLLNQFYVNWQHKLNKDITLNTGLRGQQFDLSSSMVVEPRFGIKYQLNEGQALSFGYGLHHQLQPLPVYYTLSEQPDGSFRALNQDLDFTSSHHLALAYDRSINSNLRVKAEVYYQSIANAPVERFPSSFS